MNASMSQCGVIEQLVQYKKTDLAHTELESCVGYNAKNAIASSFDMAAKSYSSRALIQQQIAKASIKHFTQHISEPIDILVDLGCGTANAQRRLGDYCNHYVGVDLSANMLKQACVEHAGLPNDTKRHYINADAEALPFSNNSINGFYSSMALQWCESPSQLLSEVYRSLANNGTAMLAIMVDGSFASLHNAWDTLNMTSRVNQFMKTDNWLKHAHDYSWRIELDEHTFLSEHKSALNMLKSIKHAGADTRLASKGKSDQTQAITRTELQALNSVLPKNKKGDLVLQYKVMFLSLHK